VKLRDAEEWHFGKKVQDRRGKGPGLINGNCRDRPSYQRYVSGKRTAKHLRGDAKGGVSYTRSIKKRTSRSHGHPNHVSSASKTRIFTPQEGGEAAGKERGTWKVCEIPA